MHSRLCMFSHEKSTIQIDKYPPLMRAIREKASLDFLMQLVSDGVDYPYSCLSFSLRNSAGNETNFIWSPLVFAAFHLDKDRNLFLLTLFQQHYAEASQTLYALRRHVEERGTLCPPINTSRKYALTDILAAANQLHYLHVALSLEAIQHIERCCSIYRVILKSGLCRKNRDENKRTCQLSFYSPNTIEHYSEAQIYLLETIQKRIITLAEYENAHEALRSCEESIRTDVFASQHEEYGIAPIYRETILARLSKIQASSIFVTSSDAYNPYQMHP
jgi:hypothetical protein